ncbi:MAG: TrkA C-terminal domain-containing protein, partial [Natronomonas sp.]
PDTEIISRVEEDENISKTYRAGADYVLSLATVTGRMSASYLLEGRNMLSIEQQIEVIRTSVPEITGQTIRDLNIREKTGCTVIAIERDRNIITDIQPDTRIEDGDELIIVGTGDGIRTFEQVFT